jgi:uncharacterized protein YneF (UPF0154 family)
MLTGTLIGIGIVISLTIGVLIGLYISRPK